MKRLSTAIAALALIGTPAFAADMAVKAPAPMAAPVYNWTGWYVGVNAGASFGHVKTDINADPVTITGTGITIPGFSHSDTLYPSGFIGGGQIGYNWQFSPVWVVGLEADFQGALEKDSSTFTQPFTATPPIFPTLFAPVLATATGTEVLNYTAKIDWFGTVRARLGYVWGNGDVLTYVTGGLAYGKVELDATSTVSGTVTGGGVGILPLTVPFSTTHVINHSQINTGWTVGFGTEGRLAGMPNWTWKVETLYMDLGSDPLADNAVGVSNTSGGVITAHAHFTDTILRGGLNYKFY